MNLNALSLFVSVVQDGSLSKASERLNVPIATISRQITELEKSLNIQLVDRKKSGVKPTMVGQQLYEQVHQSIDNLIQIEHTLQYQSSLSGKLRISTITGFEEAWTWIDEFCTRHPNIQAYCQVTDRILDLVEDGIDFAFRMGELHTETVVAKPIMTIKTKWLAHPDIIARLGMPKNLTDLANFPLVGYAKPNQKTLHIPFGKKILELPYIFASNDIHVIIHLIQHGRGIGLLSSTIANHLIKEHQLIEVLSDCPTPTYPVNILYPRHRHQSAIMKSFLTFVLEKANHDTLE